MTPRQFLLMALSLPNVEEHAHMAHPDFRVGGKVFATLGYPNKQWGMVKLSAEEQRGFVTMNAGVFVPAPGAWGLQGSTLVRLKDARPGVVEEALNSAWEALKAKGAKRKGLARGKAKAKPPKIS
jgi:hypothetical protein